MPTPRPLVAGNWKMNGLRASLAEVTAIRDAVASGAAGRADAVLCLPYTLLYPAAELISTAPGLLLGGQDCHAASGGAHTGDISSQMLKDIGASMVIVGHSERRAGHAETDDVVQDKAEAASRAGLLPIICVGETRSERDGGETLRVIGRQIDESVPQKSTGKSVVVAYEPVWAIGTGLLPSEADIAEVHTFIRRRLATTLGQEGENVRILYGGSVKPDNIAEIVGVANVDGVLIGGASLTAKDFLAIAAAYR